MTASSSSSTRQRVAIDQIAIPGNVRELDSEHVDALAASIKLRGLLVAVIVRPVGEHFELVAGFHRFAAHKQLGEKYIDVDVRDAQDEHGDRAIENIASCRRRHEAINADHADMPTSRQIGAAHSARGRCDRPISERLAASGATRRRCALALGEVGITPSILICSGRRRSSYDRADGALTARRRAR
jgi:hypothetical protein